jgi:hypothetical protein
MAGRLLTATILLSGCAAAAPPPATDAVDPTIPAWHLVYRHDADGRPLGGDKAELLAAIRRGSPVRFAWGVKVDREGGFVSVEHVAEPEFLTIVNESEVVVQLPERSRAIPPRHFSRRATNNRSRRTTAWSAFWGRSVELQPKRT